MAEGSKILVSVGEIEKACNETIAELVRQLGTEYIGLDELNFLVKIEDSLIDALKTVAQRITSLYKKVEHVETEYIVVPEDDSRYIKVTVYTKSINN